MISKLLNISQFTSPFRSKLIVKYFKPWIKKKQKVLDIGCGTGITTKVVIENFKVVVTGCDVKNYLIFNMPFYSISKKGRLPFRKQEFDLAMLNDVLHHVDKSYQTHIIKEALRIAKRVLIFEAEPTFSAKVFDTILNKLHYSSLDTPLTFRSGSDWQKLFSSMKLKVIIKKVERPLWYPFEHIAMMIEGRKK